MPVTPTYPGVYIEEIPSGVRTITGVPTSITAFVGRTKRGPVDEPISINSYSDFERIFGGLWKDSYLGYAIRDFYLNGGSRAIIVRLFNSSANGNGADGDNVDGGGGNGADGNGNDGNGGDGNGGNGDGGDATLPDQTLLEVARLNLVAAEPGSWGANLRATVDVNVSAAFAEAMDLDEDKFFNLEVYEDVPGGASERYVNLTFEDNSRRIDRVLKAESNLVRWGDDEEPTPENYPQAIQDAHASEDEAEKTIYDPVTQAQDELDELLTEKLNDPTKDEDGTEESQKRDNLKEAKKALAASDGEPLDKNSFIGQGLEGEKKGFYALEKADLFNILCIPPYKADVSDVDASLVAAAAAYCEKRRAMLLVDPPSTWNDKNDPKTGVDQVGTRSKNAALFFPRLRKPDPLDDDRIADFVPCGAVAGIFARTDTQRGVWKAPAGLDATLTGVPQLSVPLTDAENGELNPLGVNCLRSLPPAGRVVWGSRTLQGDDRLASEWKYVPVRRTALFIEESLYRGTQWVVFEPNDEPLWGQIRLNIGAFMHNLFRQGAFQGTTPREAYFVKCDSETTTQNDINLGIVNIVVGFAPLKPAEFVIIKIQQMTGQIEV